MKGYIHTIQGKPATFNGYQICYASFYGAPNVIRGTLAQIRRDQATTKRNRAKDGYPVNMKEYGYFRYA